MEMNAAEEEILKKQKTVRLNNSCRVSSALVDAVMIYCVFLC